MSSQSQMPVILTNNQNTNYQPAGPEKKESSLQLLACEHNQIVSKQNDKLMANPFTFRGHEWWRRDHLVLHVAVGVAVHGFQEFFTRHRHEALVVAVPDHGVALPGSCLAVRKQRSIVAPQSVLHHPTPQPLEHAFLYWTRTKLCCS